MSNEILAVEKFFYETLLADSYLNSVLAARVYHSRPPQIDPDDPEQEEPDYPMVLFHVAQSSDARKAGARRVFTSLDLVYKAVTKEGGSGSLGPINSRIDSLLNNCRNQQIEVSFEIDGFDALPIEIYQILGAYRTAPIQFDETTDGVRFDYLGGVYRSLVQRKFTASAF